MQVKPVKAKTPPSHGRLLDKLAAQRMLDGWKPLLHPWETKAARELERLGMVERVGRRWRLL